MAIPILINSRDRLTWTRELAEWCRELPDARVIVCDNDSSYPPLLEWLDKLERTLGEAIDVVRFGENAGPRGPWRVPHGDAEYFVVTDPDLGTGGIPRDVLEKLRWSLDEFPALVKSGLAIRVDDLPQTPIADLARSTEARFGCRNKASRRRNANGFTRTSTPRFPCTATDAGRSVATIRRCGSLVITNADICRGTPTMI